MFVWCLCVADLPTCLLCVCLTGSVYCEEVSPDMTSVPSLPKETAYLYARFNKIKKIRAKDFSDIGKSVNGLHHHLLIALFAKTYRQRIKACDACFVYLCLVQ